MGWIHPLENIILQMPLVTVPPWLQSFVDAFRVL